MPAATPPREIVVVSRVGLVKTAGKFELFNIILAPFWKLVPVIVRVGEELTGALVGLIEEIAGGGG